MRKTASSSTKTLTTMRDIAEKANVSQTTVSLVLNDRKSTFISEATRERVIATARSLGYRPNQIARALATGRTDTIGLWIRSLHSSFYTQWIYEIDQLITQSSYALITSRNAHISKVSSIMQEFPMMSVDGIIAVDIPETVDHFASDALTTPVVSIGTEATHVVDSILVELKTGTRAALIHLYASGRRSIAILLDEPAHSVGGGDRLTAYRDFMASAGLPEEVLLTTGQTPQEALTAVLHRFSTSPCPDALFCYNDNIAIGASRALRDLGLRIPDDVALVGCDDIAESLFLEPRLSTISFPRRQACALAWDYLQERLTDRDAPIKTTLMAAEFIARESS